MIYAKNIKKIFSEDKQNPHWAARKKTVDENIHPAIPFVGKNYEKTRLLVYASAENLTYYEKSDKSIDKFENDELAINRRKIKESKTSFFPNIHIAPINDGSLLICAAYILEKLNEELKYTTPYEFIENIAVDNFCKFSIKTGSKNIDYAKDLNKLEKSFAYVEEDLKILQPGILIIPKTIYRHKSVRDMIKKMGLYQIS
ncbi:MAG: hypothetical protein ACRC4W_01775 [Treponemataceae bacterium]